MPQSASCRAPGPTPRRLASGDQSNAARLIDSHRGMGSVRCEANYAHSWYVAELFNVCSNLTFSPSVSPAPFSSLSTPGSSRRLCACA